MPQTAAAAPLQAQSLPLRIDCGDLNGDAAPEPGWTLFSQTQSPQGMSFSPAPQDTVHVAGKTPSGATPVPADVYAVDPDELGLRHRLTSLKLADPTTLTITGLPASKPLRVRLELGALAPWADTFDETYVLGPSTPSTAIRVEEQKTASPLTWRSLARDVRCTTSASGNSFTTVLGGIVSVWVLAHSDSTGKLVLRFSSTASGGADPIYLAGFEVHNHEPLPVVYHKQGGGGPLVAQHPALAAFATAFNLANYDLAETAAAALTDPFQRGVARCWLIGWLDGSRDGRFDLLPLARDDLVAAMATHPAAHWLLSQLDDLQRALDHLDARGYAWAGACPSEGGFGFLNPNCAGQTAVLGLQGFAPGNVNAHLALRRLAGLCTPAAGTTIRADVDAWNAAPIGYGAWEPGPFMFAAAKQYGVTISMINPLLNLNQADPGSVAFLQAFKDVFQTALTGGGFEESHFPRDMELPLFREFANQASHPNFWSDATIASVLTDAQIDSAWWGPLVAKLPFDPLTSGWVAKQRDTLMSYHSAVDYWLQERLIRGELGGGNGDDVEALLQFYPLFACRQDPGDAKDLAAIEALIRFVLVESGDVTNGYFSGVMTDVEHSGEYTSNTFQALRAVFGYTARAIETGLGIGWHLKAPTAPATAWTATTGLGRLHFKNYLFTAAGPDNSPAQAYDIPLNGRGTYPAVATVGRGALLGTHPLVTDLRQWASAWRDDALDTSAGKPKGFFGPVGWPGNQFGGAGKWWTIGTSATDTGVWGNGDASYVLELLRSAYEQSTATDRWRYLLPIVRVMRTVKTWEDAGKPTGSAGSTNWIAAQFFNGARFHALVVANLSELEHDPVLTTTDDPDTAGTTPYVDEALVTRMRTWVETTNLAAPNLALRYALQPVSDCLPIGPSAKSTGIVDFSYDRAIPYFRAIFPLLTKHVLHTDRLFLNRNGILGHLTAGHTGMGLTEGVMFRPAVRWSSAHNSLDGLAISCNWLSYDGTAFGAFLHHLNLTPLPLDLSLDEGLVPGRYQVELGPALAKCDEFPLGSSAVIVQKRGAGAKVPLLIPPGLSLVRVTRLGPPDQASQRWDLALDPPRMTLGSSLAIRARVVNAGAASSPPATLRLYATLLNVQGQAIWPAYTKLLFATISVPALAGSNGYALASSDASGSLPLAAVASLLLTGLGVEIRAELTADGLEWDPLNNGLSRRFYLPDLEAVVHPN